MLVEDKRENMPLFTRLLTKIETQYSSQEDSEKTNLRTKRREIIKQLKIIWREKLVFVNIHPSIHTYTYI